MNATPSAGHSWEANTEQGARTPPDVLPAATGRPGRSFSEQFWRYRGTPHPENQRKGDSVSRRQLLTPPSSTIIACSRFSAARAPSAAPSAKSLAKLSSDDWNTGVSDPAVQPELAFEIDATHRARVSASSRSPLVEELRAFREFGTETRVLETHGASFSGDPIMVPTFVNEFWTARQRQASSLHEVSYRACFKPQLPRFFIDRLTEGGDPVYDPFMGRGTTVLEAALLGRIPYGCDINPLSQFLIQPRLNPPRLDDIKHRLDDIPLYCDHELPEDLLVFYHAETLRQLCSLRAYLLERKASGSLDVVDGWIWMVALNRLTGHSNGFFSVYTLPPNQATSVTAQKRINAKRDQVPTPRDVAKLIVRKSKQLMKDLDEETRMTLSEVAANARLVTGPATATPQLAANSVPLVVTSPPFLDIVDYARDNWLRCWFVGVDPGSVQISMHRKLEQWQATMTDVFRELARVLRPGGCVAFEVGEVRGGRVKLEEAVLPCGGQAGLEPVLILVNDQEFTKTANCWGVDNNSKGTNTNRIVLFRKP